MIKVTETKQIVICTDSEINTCRLKRSDYPEDMKAWERRTLGLLKSWLEKSKESVVIKHVSSGLNLSDGASRGSVIPVEEKLVREIVLKALGSDEVLHDINNVEVKEECVFAIRPTRRARKTIPRVITGSENDKNDKTLDEILSAELTGTTSDGDSPTVPVGLKKWILTVQENDSLDELRSMILERNIERGKVLSFKVNDDGILIRQIRQDIDGGVQEQVVLPRVWEVIRPVILRHHKTLHSGIASTRYQVQKYWWWPNMKKDIAKVVQECEICRLVRGKAGLKLV